MSTPLTPFVRVDEARALRNIQRFQAYCDQHQLRLRPHIKTHKTLALAEAQMAAGAVGITCQKVSEAEVFAAAGFQDILITYNLLGSQRLERLAKLREHACISVVADHPYVVDGLAKVSSPSGEPLAVSVEVDTGAKRCGTSSLIDTVQLAQYIEAHSSLRFAGLMTYPPKGTPQAAAHHLSAFRQALAAVGLPCETISSGGSPDMWQAHLVPGLTEYRVGTYVYFDRSLLDRGVCQLEDCALTVQATVISIQGKRFVLDAGSKALTSDLIGCDGYGLILEYPHARIHKLSEEHGHVDASQCESLPRLGEVVSVLPNHACPVSNLFDHIWFYREDGTYEQRAVAARGCVT